jgi:hypothetical protein
MFRVARLSLLAAFAICPHISVLGQGSIVSQVTYSPSTTAIQINPIQLPSTTTFPLTIKAPAVASFPASVKVRLVKELTSADSVPAGTGTVALNYVSFSGPDLGPIENGHPTLTFTEANQSKTVIVAVSFPTSVVPGSYGYKLVTVDWPASLGSFVKRSSTNLGSDINASVSVNQTVEPPVVTIVTPTAGQDIFNVTPADLTAVGGFPVSLGFTATAAASAINSVTAEISPARVTAGSNVPILVSGLNTTLVSGTGTIGIPSAGEWVVTVRATNAGGTASNSKAFVVQVNSPPPTVAIIAPANDPDYTYFVGGNPVVVPNRFEASTAGGTSITGFTARLTKGSFAQVLAVSPPTGLGTPSAWATTPLALTESGQYTLWVTAYNNYNSATTSATFWINRVVNPADVTVNVDQNATFSINAAGAPGLTYRWQRGSSLGSFADIVDGAAGYSGQATSALTVVAPVLTQNGDQFRCVITRVSNGVVLNTILTGAATLTVIPVTTVDLTISGIVYADLSPLNGRQLSEPGLGDVVVQLMQTGQTTRTFTTTAGGAYSFTVTPGTYTIDVVEPAGMVPTAGAPAPITMTTASVTNDIGLALVLNAVRGLRGDGNSHGYWKNNLSKALEGRTSGMQETRANLLAWTSAVSTFYLANPFGGITMQDAVTVLSGRDQLALQLLASEYNYVSGRLINNSRPLTAAFIAWGEYVLNDASSPTPIYNAAYRTYVKDWMDAFNNSHGGLVRGPVAR